MVIFTLDNKYEVELDLEFETSPKMVCTFTITVAKGLYKNNYIGIVDQIHANFLSYVDDDFIIG